MILEQITFTGADDRTSIRELADISKQHQHVEWGILNSRHALKGLSLPLLPGLSWVDKFLETDTTRCLHICGELCRKFIAGYGDFIDVFGADRLRQFQRIQLNFHDSDEKLLNVPALRALLETHRLIDTEIIVPVGQENLRAIREMRQAGIKAIILFDESRGAGIRPDGWPEPIADIKCGYAGGLAPNNIRRELGKISLVTPSSYTTWVDMERRVREGKTFALDKVAKCITESSDYLS
jgi:hypothetical protein